MKLFRIASALLAAASMLNLASASDLDFYVGTYTKKEGSRGIYHFRLDSETGVVAGGELAVETPNPSYVAVHPSGRFVYSVAESGPPGAKKFGAVGAFAIEGDGKLTPLNQQPAGGDGPCHISVAADGRHAFVANYSSGSIEALPIKADGRLGEPTALIQHTGSGPNLQRQQGPHAHGIYELDGFVYACDLGTDHVDLYKLDADKGTLTPGTPPFAAMTHGSGPRHLALHGGYAYVIAELMNMVTVFQRDATTGALTPLQSISTLPAGYENSSTCAEIFVHPNGKFLYGSNRGHDSLAVFAIGSDGKLTLVELAPSLGKAPRGFAIDPTGHWLLAAHQDTDNLVVFKIDSATGKLTPTGQNLPLGSPVCVAFVPAK